MPPVAAERWFHTLVVLGAALGGCGGKTSEPKDQAASSSGGTESGGGSASAGRPSQAAGGSGALTPEACSFHGEFVCDDYATLSNCRCDPSAPHDASDCSSPFDFVCDEIPCVPSPTLICLGAIDVGCRCDPSALRPEDCAAPEQFFCDTSRAMWHGCACHPERADDPASCVDGYCCQSYDPRFGCECCIVARIK